MYYWKEDKVHCIRMETRTVEHSRRASHTGLGAEDNCWCTTGHWRGHWATPWHWRGHWSAPGPGGGHRESGHSDTLGHSGEDTAEDWSLDALRPDTSAIYKYAHVTQSKLAVQSLRIESALTWKVVFCCILNRWHVVQPEWWTSAGAGEDKRGLGAFIAGAEQPGRGGSFVSPYSEHRLHLRQNSWTLYALLHTFCHLL